MIKDPLLFEIGKANSAKMTMTNTTGSKSLARIADEWGKQHGYMPARHEVFIKSHTLKDGNAQVQAAEMINKIKETCLRRPELATKTIQEGDLYSNLFGKEKRARVRGVGMGPTPQDLKMAGVRGSSTKLKLIMRAKIRAESENTLLRERLDAHEEQMSKVLKEMEELKKSANFTRPVEQNNNHGSPSPMEMQDMNIPGSNSPIQDMNNYASNSSMQNMRGQSDDSGARSIVNENRIPHSEIIQKKVAAQNVGNYNHRAGRDVILLSIIGQSVPVAKATVQRTTRSTVVGGTSLGIEYCEVIVNYVLKKNAPLP